MIYNYMAGTSAKINQPLKGSIQRACVIVKKPNFPKYRVNERFVIFHDVTTGRFWMKFPCQIFQIYTTNIQFATFSCRPDTTTEKDHRLKVGVKK